MKKSILIIAMITSGCSPNSVPEAPHPQASKIEKLQAPPKHSNLAEWDGSERLIKISGFGNPQINIKTDDGCKTKQLTYQPSDKPSANIEFKCNRINIFWTQFQEAEFAADNAEALKKTTKFLEILAGSPELAAQAMDHAVFRGEPQPSGFKVSGSCSLDTCLLTLDQ